MKPTVAGPFFSLRLFLLAIACLLPVASRAQARLTAAETVVGYFSYTSGVAVDANANVYVCESNSTIAEMLAADGYTKVVNFQGGFNSAAGVAVDSSGNVFVADTGNSQIKEMLAVGGKLPATPTIRVLGGSFAFQEPMGVAVDASGNVFVADTWNDAVEEIEAVDGKIPASSPTVRILGNGFNGPNDVKVDGSGNVFVADTYNNVIKEIVAVDGKIPASSPTIKSMGSGFYYPLGVALDGSGNVYVSDGLHNAVKEIVAEGGYSTIFTLGTIFTTPVGVAVDGSGNVFVGDSGNSRVMEIELGPVNLGLEPLGTAESPLPLTFLVAADTKVESVAVLTTGVAGKDFINAAGSTCAAKTYTEASTCQIDVSFKPLLPGLRRGTVALYGAGDNPLAEVPVYGVGIGPLAVFLPAVQSTIGSGFKSPGGVAVDANGNIFVGDYGNKEVKEVLAAGGYTTIKKLGSGFNGPAGVAVDGAGNVFVADSGAHEVKEIVAGGGYATVNTVGSGFDSPQGLAVDGSGNVFVADPGKSAVYEIFGGGGYGTVRKLGSGFEAPAGVAVDASGNVFVADGDKNKVYEILAADQYATVKELGSGFDTPIGVAVDAAGNVLVADAGGNKVEELLAGDYTTIKELGSGFKSPASVAVDGNGNVLVADFNNNRVVRLNSAAPPVLSFDTTAGGSTSKDSPRPVSVLNAGNAELDFSKLTYPTDFRDDGSSCNASTELADGGDDCTVIVAFSPVTVSGTSTSLALKESVDLATDTLSVPNTAQQMALSGTETKVTPGLALKASSTKMVLGTGVTLTATATGKGAAVAGLVTFLEDGKQIGTPVALAKSVAKLDITLQKSGTLAATYAGDAVYAEEKSNAVAVTLEKATPTVTLTAFPNPAVSGASVKFTATVSEAAGVEPTATVEFYVDGKAYGSQKLSAGVAAVSDSKIAVGTHSIKAKYTGNANYLAASSSLGTLIILE